MLIKENHRFLQERLSVSAEVFHLFFVWGGSSLASLLPTRFKPKSWNRRFKHWASKGILKVGQLVTQENFMTYLEIETNAANLVKPLGLCSGSDHHRSCAVPGGRAGAGGTWGTPAAAWGGHLGAEYIIFFCVPSCPCAVFVWGRSSSSSFRQRNGRASISVPFPRFLVGLD